MGLGGISEKHRVIKDDAENCPFVEYFKRYFITFQILFWESQCDIFCWLMGRCLCAFMCGEVQRVGESHFSQVLWHIKGVFFVGCSFSRLTQNRLPIPTWGAHETLADCKEDAAAFGWWGRRMHSTGNRALDPHLSVCVCVFIEGKWEASIPPKLAAAFCCPSPVHVGNTQELHDGLWPRLAS